MAICIQERKNNPVRDGARSLNWEESHHLLWITFNLEAKHSLLKLFEGTLSKQVTKNRRFLSSEWVSGRHRGAKILQTANTLENGDGGERENELENTINHLVLQTLYCSLAVSLRSASRDGINQLNIN